MKIILQPGGEPSDGCVSASAMGEFEKPAFLRFIMGSVLSGAECPNQPKSWMGA
jgi:hypothetical protein